MRAGSCQGKSHTYFANLKHSLSLCLRQIQLPHERAFLALPPGELAFAEQMTERAEKFTHFASSKSERICSPLCRSIKFLYE